MPWLPRLPRLPGCYLDGRSGCLLAFEGRGYWVHDGPRCFEGAESKDGTSLASILYVFFRGDKGAAGLSAGSARASEGTATAGAAGLAGGLAGASGGAGIAGGFARAASQPIAKNCKCRMYSVLFHAV